MASWEHPAGRHPVSGLSPLQLLGLLGDTELGPAAADGFSLLMAESPDVLHKGCHADVRIMFRQRFFTDNVPKLVQGFHGAGPGEWPPPAQSRHPVSPYPGDLTWCPPLPWLPVTISALHRCEGQLPEGPVPCTQPSPQACAGDRAAHGESQPWWWGQGLWQCRVHSWELLMSPMFSPRAAAFSPA